MRRGGRSRHWATGWPHEALRDGDEQESLFFATHPDKCSAELGGEGVEGWALLHAARGAEDEELFRQNLSRDVAVQAWQTPTVFGGEPVGNRAVSLDSPLGWTCCCL